MTSRRSFLTATAAVAVALLSCPLFAQSARSGTFEGRSRHTTTGTATLDGQSIALGDDFALDNGPDPVVGLGRDGTYDPATYSGDLVSLSGAQAYTLPDGVEPSDYNEVYIWCRAADVPLGIATLN